MQVTPAVAPAQGSQGAPGRALATMPALPVSVEPAASAVGLKQDTEKGSPWALFLAPHNDRRSLTALKGTPVRKAHPTWISYLAVLSIGVRGTDEVRGTHRVSKGSKQHPCLTQRLGRPGEAGWKSGRQKERHSSWIPSRAVGV